jgi:hypothetical protein
MGDQAPEVTAKLDALQRDVTEMKTTLNRVVIGENGDGILDRQARTEERLTSTRVFAAFFWMCTWVFMLYLAVRK